MGKKKKLKIIIIKLFTLGSPGAVAARVEFAPGERHLGSAKAPAEDGQKASIRELVHSKSSKSKKGDGNSLAEISALIT